MKIIQDAVCSSCGAFPGECLLLDEDSEWTDRPLCSGCLRDIIHRFLEHTGMKVSDFDL